MIKMSSRKDQQQGIGISRRNHSRKGGAHSPVGVAGGARGISHVGGSLGIPRGKGSPKKDESQQQQDQYQSIQHTDAWPEPKEISQSEFKRQYNKSKKYIFHGTNT